MTVPTPVITIDGPSGSGKGTVARLIATRLGWHLLDSGALYRVLGLYAQRQGVALDDEERLGLLARELPVTFVVDANMDQRILLAGEDVSLAIRTEEAGSAASQVAALPVVRAGLLERQREFRQPPGLVADGRDMGTVVFSDAPVKIFLVASVEERARRRHKQLIEQGLDGNLLTLLRDIAERDRRDATRAVAPLKPADDAVTVDSTGLGIEAVVERVLQIAESRLGASLLGKDAR
jgi:cytidylate kinase